MLGRIMLNKVIMSEILMSALFQKLVINSSKTIIIL